jgi:hypothetical protein
MKLSAALGFIMFAASSTASAICIVPSLPESIASAKAVFIATITDSTLLVPVGQLKDGDWYTVRYGFVVVKRIKGSPSIVRSLTTRATFISPAGDYLDGPAEQDRFVPGESVLVVADGPGDVPLSSISCRPSRPWNDETYRLTRSIPGFSL